VAATSDSIAAGTSLPLAGTSVLVTRTREQAGALVEPLEALGAEVLAFPVIETVDPEDWGPADAAIRALGSYDWLVLTSTNGVDRFFERLDALGVGRSALEGVKLAVVGTATARQLGCYGLSPDMMPGEFRGEGIVDEFRATGAGPETRVLIARALEAREILPESLHEMGVHVDVVPVYRVVPSTPNPAVLARLAEGSVDIATIASGGTAAHFVELLRTAGLNPATVMASLTVASVGPVTTEGLRALGYEVDVEASESTMESLVEALVEHCRA
jgi:uroporphyrinogen III methyltransferase/synthase